MASDAVTEAVENLREAMLADDMDEATVDAKLAAVVPNQTNLVGNLADLHRVGALVADEEVDNANVLEAAVEIPPEAPVDGEPANSPAPSGDLAGMTKDELLAEADRRGVEVSASSTKAEITAALEG